MLTNSQGQLTGDQFALGQLLATNKSLAQEKREVHRQKLRTYSEKAVKLKEMLRNSDDADERRCLESKLKALQEKQDAEISKLAKIEQIEKEIDEFITEESEELPESSSQKFKKKQRENDLHQKISAIQNTPAQRLRTKSSVPHRNFFESNEENNPLERSLKNGSFTRKESRYCHNEQWLLTQSKGALKQLANNDLQQEKRENKSRKSVKQVLDFGNGSKAVKQKEQNHKKQQSNSNKFDRIEQQLQKLNSQHAIPSKLAQLINKIAKFFPKQLPNLLEYISQNEATKNQHKKENRIAESNMKNEDKKLKKLASERQIEEQRINDIEERINSLIEEERLLMERIDKLQNEETVISKRITGFLHSVKKSKQIIMESSLGSMEQLNFSNSAFGKQQMDKIHKFSVDSFESANSFAQSTASLSHELNIFQRTLQQFLLAAERQSMLAGGQMQQSSLKAARIKQELSTLQSKRRQLDSDVSRIDKTLAGKREMLNELEEHFDKMSKEIHDYDAVTDLKRTLVSELEEKCEKLKGKKKSLTDKLKKAEEDWQSVTTTIADKSEYLCSIQKETSDLQKKKEELETNLIFSQRELERKKAQIAQLEKNKSNLMKQIDQNSKVVSSLGSKLKENQSYLAELSLQITARSNDETTLSQRARKLQQQLAESSSLLEQQNSIIVKQKEQITLKSAEHLELQQKLAILSANVSAQESERAQIESHSKALKLECEHSKTELQQIRSAKEDLEDILREVIVKKEALLFEVEDRSKELQILLQDLEQGQQDLKELHACLQTMDETLGQKEKDIAKMEDKLTSLGRELDQNLKQESNILSRMTKLREIEKIVFIEGGIKGMSNFMEGELKLRVTEAVAELSTLQQVKNQLKECKFENRKLRLDNQRLSKLLEDEGLDANK